MKVCVCAKVNKEKIEQLVAEGKRDWIDASESCGAGRYCGGCLHRFRSLFKAAKKARARRKAA